MQRLGPITDDQVPTVGYVAGNERPQNQKLIDLSLYHN